MHASICDQLHDLVQNAIEARASRIKVRWVTAGGWQEITIEDNGCGMDSATKDRALDPFYTDGVKHRHRRVGLGLAFLKQMVADTGGDLTITSEVGVGTKVFFRLDQAHIDIPPLGDVVRSIVGLMAFQGDYELELFRAVEGKHYAVNRSSLREALGDLDSGTSLTLMRDYIASHEEALQKG